MIEIGLCTCGNLVHEVDNYETQQRRQGLFSPVKTTHFIREKEYKIIPLSGKRGKGPEK